MSYNQTLFGSSGGINGSATTGVFSGDVLSLDKPSGSNAMQKTEYVSVGIGSTITLANTAGFQAGQAKVPAITGPGYIANWSLQIGPGAADTTCFQNSSLIINVDGVQTVNMPLQMFFMCDQTVYQNDGNNVPASYQSKWMGLNSNQNDNTGFVSVWCLLPIPYTTSASISITNGSSSNTMTAYSIAEFRTGVPNTWAGTQKFLAKYSPILHTAVGINSCETYLNVAPGKPGRFAGFYWSHDPAYLSWSVGQDDFEGNFRIYCDCFNFTWAAGVSVPAGATLIDSNGNLQTTVAGGESGLSAPTWSTTPGGSTTDNIVTWVMTHGDATTVWQASKPYKGIVHSIIDPNGNIQVCTTPGTSNSTPPAWASTNGATTSDNSVTWTCYTTYQPAQYNSSGTEDYFLIGFYFNAPYYQNKSGVVETGITFNGGDAMGVYRWHSQSPLRFNSSIAVIRQRGDTSQASLSDPPNTLGVCYYYTNH